MHRVRAELKVFTDWLARYDVDGYVGEVGWPNSMPADMDRWNALAAAWFADAREADLWVSAWSTGAWWPPTHANSIYVRSEGSPWVDTPRPQATVLEAQQPWQRGINVNGGEFGTPRSTDATHEFSNANPGAYDTAYHYDRQESFDYLASRGITTVRLAFRWERIQPTLGGPLDPAERDRLTAAVERAHQAGLGVILDVHNYGAYWLDDGGQGVRRAIGSPEVPLARFTDLWLRLSRHFKDNRALLAYGLMNEPLGMPALPGGTEAQQWERASQQALDAIRATGDTTTVLVSGYHWSGAWRWSTIHPAPWIRDPADNVRYEAHHYFDRDRSGTYSWTYDQEVADTTARAD